VKIVLEPRDARVSPMSIFFNMFLLHFCSWARIRRMDDMNHKISIAVYVGFIEGNGGCLSGPFDYISGNKEYDILCYKRFGM
jgi:hypothetical protein